MQCVTSTLCMFGGSLCIRAPRVAPVRTETSILRSRCGTPRQGGLVDSSLAVLARPRMQFSTTEWLIWRLLAIM
eukprot:2630959-Amphidinium_carterae.1